MKRDRSLSIVVGSACALIACGGGDPTLDGERGVGGTGASPNGASVSASNLPCDVQTVLAESCWQCHGTSPQFGAPMPLVTAADFEAVAKSSSSSPVHELVKSRIASTTAPMPPPPNPMLDGAAQRALTDWIEAGRPTSNEVCSASAGGIDLGKLDCPVDVEIRPGSSYEVPKDLDDVYVCYGFSRPATEKRHIFALGPHIDNAKVVHHLLVYQTAAPVDSTPHACEGVGQSLDWKLLMGWAPGGRAVYLPEEAGFVQEPDSSGMVHYALQIHYNNVARNEGERDASGFNLCTTDQLRRYDADAMAPGAMFFTIPPRASQTTTCNYVWGSGSGIPVVEYPSIHVFSTTPHMHAFGTEVSSTIIRKDTGEEVPIDEARAFDIDNQVLYPASVDIHPGDTIRTRCRWNNTTSEPVEFGEGTADEMCFNFMGYYPKVPKEAVFAYFTPSAVPSLTFGCQSTR